MGNQLKIYCKNTEEYIDITGGETLMEIFGRIGHTTGVKQPVCARVNNKTEGLDYPVYAPKQVEFLDVASSSGNRVYIRSLCMMLYKAVADCYKGASLRIEHSVSRGYYGRILGAGPVTADMIATLREAMRRIVELDLPFERKERLTKDVIEIFRREGLDDKVLLLSTNHELYTVYYRLGDIYDSYYGCLAPSTGMLSTFDLIPYEEGFLLLGPDPDKPGETATPIAQEKMYRAFTEHLEFNSIIGVRNVGELNTTVDRREAPMLINVAEALHEKYIGTIASRIAHRYHDGGAKVVLIAGPSSSGKTTFTKRLSIQLTTNLLEPKMISLDNYFINRDKTPRDEYGEYDFESLYALDLEAFNNDLNRLIAGEEVELPYYNFEKGEREYRGEKIRLGERSILLIEGIHGLNPELTAHVDDRMKYRIYVSALTTLSIDDHSWVPTTDNRLLRRIIRDHKYRGVSPADTIRRWPSVRRGEERWIFPYQENADAMFNSSLIFELGVMRQYGEEILRSVPRDMPEYAEAYRLRRFLAYFTPISEKYVPSTSLLREFLGGSSFHY